MQQPFGEEAPGGKFRTGQRVDITKGAAFSQAMAKEKAHAYAGIGGGDALDEFVIEVGNKPVISHSGFLQRPDAVSRLLQGNVFPTACFVGKQAPWIHSSRMSDDNARPWKMMAYRQERNIHTPINRQHYHMPNQFGEEVAAASRMGLKMFGARGA